jgi:hypothetical protein
MIGARCFQHVGGQAVEVFRSPFEARVRALANRCFNTYFEARGRDLDWDTANGDTHAWSVLRATLAMEIGASANDPAWHAELRAIQTTIRRGSALTDLHVLAWDGGGWRPAGETYDWAERMEGHLA